MAADFAHHGSPKVTASQTPSGRASSTLSAKNRQRDAGSQRKRQDKPQNLYESHLPLLRVLKEANWADLDAALLHFGVMASGDGFSQQERMKESKK